MRKILGIILVVVFLCGCKKPIDSSQNERDEPVIEQFYEEQGYKKVTDEERKKWSLLKADGYDFDAIYYSVYEDEVAEDKYQSDNDAIVLDIKTNKMADYDEKICGTYKIPECYSGYINMSDEFSVNYIDGIYHIKGVFVDGNWNVEKSNIEDVDSCDTWTEVRDGTLWGVYREGDYGKLIVLDQSGKTLYHINLKKWQKQNGYSKALFRNVIPLLDGKCILIFEEDGKETSCQLDMSSESVIRKYERGLRGIPDGDYLYYLEGNQLNVYDYKNAKEKMSVNIDNLWEGYMRKDLVYYDNNTMDFFTFDNPYSDVKMCVNDNKVYFSLWTGVFEWTVGEEIIYKVLDGEKTEYFRKMNGILNVGKNGVIYMLGEFGYEDEGGAPSKFLVMTP